MEKNINKNLTTVIYETKQDDEVLDEKIHYSDAEEADTELEYNTVMGFDDLTIPGAKKYHWNYIIAAVW